MTEHGDLIDRLEDIKSEIHKSIGQRRIWFYINNTPEKEQKEFFEARKVDGRDDVSAGGIYPSPGNNPNTGQTEWRWHRLVHKKDFFTQKECLEGLMKEIDDMITMLLEDEEQKIPAKTEQELLRDIIIKAHDMGVLVASKEEMKLLPAEHKMLEIFDKLNDLQYSDDLISELISKSKQLKLGRS